MAIDIERLSELMPDRQIVWLEETASTMVDAEQLAGIGCVSGTVVGAERQTAGQGRHGRSWHSPDDGLYFSVVLRLNLQPQHLPILTMAIGLAVAEAVPLITGVPVDLRWPNDVMIGDRKVCGILVHQQDGTSIAGIGINVNRIEFPPEISHLAISLHQASGREHPREPLLAAILESLDRHIDLLQSEGSHPILRMFTNASSYASGRRVVVDQAGDTVIGTTEGLDEHGFLVVRRDNGTRAVIMAGGVRPI